MGVCKLLARFSSCSCLRPRSSKRERKQWQPPDFHLLTTIIDKRATRPYSWYARISRFIVSYRIHRISIPILSFS